jgi:hypothetical protein
MKIKPNGVFISNGPGDPAVYKGAIKVCRDLISNNILSFCRIDEELSQWIEATTTFISTKKNYP